MKPTPEMTKAGDDMAALLISVRISRDMHGLGGCRSLEEVLTGIRNADLAVQYCKDEITSTEAIYMAMRRAAPAELDLPTQHDVEHVLEHPGSCRSVSHSTGWTLCNSKHQQAVHCLVEELIAQLEALISLDTVGDRVTWREAEDLLKRAKETKL